MQDRVLPPGFKFRPTDRELVRDYLLRKVRGQQLPWNGIQFCDLYGVKSPWEIFHDSDQEEENNLHVFTRLKKASLKRVSRVAGCGTWHGETSGLKIYGDKEKKRLIGLKKTFSFKVKNESKKSHWIMHEFSLAGEALMGNQSCSDYVVCRLQKSRCLKEKSGGVEIQDGIGLEQGGFGDLNWVHPFVENLNFNQRNGAVASFEQEASVNFSCLGENSVGNQAGYTLEGSYSFSGETSSDSSRQENLEFEFGSIENYSTTIQVWTGGQNLSAYKDHSSTSEIEAARIEFGSVENPDILQVNVEKSWNSYGFESENMLMKNDNLLPIQKNNNEVGMILEPEVPCLKTLIQDTSFLSGIFQCPIQESSTTHQIDMSSNLGDGLELEEYLRQEKYWTTSAMDLEELPWNDDQNKKSSDLHRIQVTKERILNL